MRRTFQLALPNGTFGDPVVVVRPRLLPRVILFDVGDLSLLGTRALLAVTDVLVSHAHMDHSFGLGRLLRIRLGRLERPLRVFGPPGMVRRVAAHLEAYTWNLVDAYPLDLTVIEIHESGPRTWSFPQAGGFAPQPVPSPSQPENGPVFADGLFEIDALLLDHAGIPSVAFKISEQRALNIDGDRLDRLGLEPGPWLAELKQIVRDDAPDDTLVAIPGSSATTLGELKQELIRETPGDILAYASDITPSKENLARLIDFSHGARRLILEAHFLEEDRHLAERHGHLTAADAGRAIRAAEVVGGSLVHFSPRYLERGLELFSEAVAYAAPVPIEPLAATPENGGSNGNDG